MACRRVRPTAWSTCRSATVAEAYRATVWPMRKKAASQCRHREGQQAGGLVSGDLAEGSGEFAALFHTSMSDRPVTRARSARNAGIAAGAAPEPHQRVDVAWPFVPMMLARYRANSAGDGSTPPGAPGRVHDQDPQGPRPTPTIRARSLGPRGGRSTRRIPC